MLAPSPELLTAIQQRDAARLQWDAAIAAMAADRGGYLPARDSLDRARQAAQRLAARVRYLQAMQGVR